MDLTTFFFGSLVAIGTVVGFFFMLRLQDRYIQKMRDRFDGDSSLRV